MNLLCAAQDGAVELPHGVQETTRLFFLSLLPRDVASNARMSVENYREIGDVYMHAPSAVKTVYILAIAS